MKQTLPQHYDRLTRRHYQDRSVAQRYCDEYTGPPTLRTLPARLIALRERRIIDRAMTYICGAGPVQRIIDLPCGTGKLASVFAHFQCTVVAADISSEMMEIADPEYRKLAGFAGLVQTDAAATTFADAEFDAVVCLRLLHRVPYNVRESILTELNRICRKYVILSAGIDSQLQGLRRDLRRVVTGTSTVPYPITKSDLALQLTRAGLTPLRWVPVFRLLSSEWVVICEKRNPAQ